jgi:hypothetical protein
MYLDFSQRMMMLNLGAAAQVGRDGLSNKS